jgi:hypothetical protein
LDRALTLLPIGAVASGQKSADVLLIGDRVVKATIEQR